MADNFPITPGTGRNAATDEVTYSGDTADVQLMRLVQVTGSEGSKTVVNLPGDATDGLLVNLGTNNDVTVSGVSTAANQSTIIGHVDGIETLLGTIDADTSTLAGAVSGTEMQVDVLTMPTVTVNAHAVTNAGTFATQVDGAALTALQLIDDPVQVLGTDTYTEATSKGVTMGAVRRDADTTLVNTTNEFGPLQMDANGRLKVEAFSGETLPVSLTSTTVTGTVAVTQSGTWDEVGINDSGNSITVDAPVGTPVNVQIGNATLSAGVIDETGASAVDALAIGGGTAHDAVNSGNPLYLGAQAIAHGTNPTAVAAADRTRLYANRAGIPFFIGGHPNIVSAEYFTSGAITDDNILPAISAGTIYVIMGIAVTCSNANVTSPSVRIGFGTANVPTQGATNADAVAKVVLSHPGIAPGSGISKGFAGAIVGIGGDGEELRLTCTTPTTSMCIQVDYFTIES